MAFLHFGAVYELFADISIALAGFDVAQRYLADMFVPEASDFKEDLGRMENGLTVLKDNIAEDLTDSEPSDFLIFFDKRIDNLTLEYRFFRRRLANSSLLKNKDDEMIFAKFIASAFSVFSFSFCLMILIIGGLQEIRYPKSFFADGDLYLIMVADFEIFWAIVTLFSIGLYFCAKTRAFIDKSSYGSVFVTFVLFVGISGGFSILKIGFWNIHKELIYGVSFLICLLPFLALAYRYILYLYVLKYQNKRRLRKQNRKLEKLEKQWVTFKQGQLPLNFI